MRRDWLGNLMNFFSFGELCRLSVLQMQRSESYDLFFLATFDAIFSGFFWWFLSVVSFGTFGSAKALQLQGITPRLMTVGNHSSSVTVSSLLQGNRTKLAELSINPAPHLDQRGSAVAFSIII